jgi:hypothetical protein
MTKMQFPAEMTCPTCHSRAFAFDKAHAAKIRKGNGCGNRRCFS